MRLHLASFLLFLSAQNAHGFSSLSFGHKNLSTRLFQSTEVQGEPPKKKLTSADILARARAAAGQDPVEVPESKFTDEILEDMKEALRFLETRVKNGPGKFSVDDLIQFQAATTRVVDEMNAKFREDENAPAQTAPAASAVATPPAAVTATPPPPPPPMPSLLQQAKQQQPQQQTPPPPPPPQQTQAPPPPPPVQQSAPATVQQQSAPAPSAELTSQQLKFREQMSRYEAQLNAIKEKANQPAPAAAAPTQPEVIDTSNDEGPAYTGKGGLGLASGTTNTYVIPGMDQMTGEEYRKALQDSVIARQEQRRQVNRNVVGNRAAHSYLEQLGYGGASASLGQGKKEESVPSQPKKKMFYTKPEAAAPESEQDMHL